MPRVRFLACRKTRSKIHQKLDIKQALNQSSWTKETGDEIDRLTYKYLKIRPGCPMFTTIIVDCDVVVYLDISDELLAQHCEKRHVNFEDSKRIKEAVESDWNYHKVKGDKVMYYIMMTE